MFLCIRFKYFIIFIHKRYGKHCFRGHLVGTNLKHPLNTISDLHILVKTCILLYKYKINSRQILRLLLEKYTKEVIEYFNNNCSVDETIILTEMIKKLFILSIKHRKEFPVHLLSQCKKGQTLSKSRNRSETDLFCSWWNFYFRTNISWFGKMAWAMLADGAQWIKYFGNIFWWNFGK